MVQSTCADGANEPASQEQPHSTYGIPTALAFEACCSEALHVQQAWLRARAIRGAGAIEPGSCPQRRRAWVTLLTNAAYAHGVRALANSLAEVESDFPLVVLVTSGVTSAVREQCTQRLCRERNHF